MSDSALASRVRDYIRQHRAAVSETILRGRCEDMIAYHAGCARLEEMDALEAEISEIMKDINSGV